VVDCYHQISQSEGQNPRTVFQDESRTFPLPCETG